MSYEHWMYVPTVANEEEQDPVQHNAAKPSTPKVHVPASVDRLGPPTKSAARKQPDLDRTRLLGASGIGSSAGQAKRRKFNYGFMEVDPETSRRNAARIALASGPLRAVHYPSTSNGSADHNNPVAGHAIMLEYATPASVAPVGKRAVGKDELPASVPSAWAHTETVAASSDDVAMEIDSSSDHSPPPSNTRASVARSSDPQNPAPAATLSEAEIEKCLRDLVRNALESGYPIDVRGARFLVERQLGLKRGFFGNTPEWQARSENIVLAASREGGELTARLSDQGWSLHGR